MAGAPASKRIDAPARRVLDDVSPVRAAVGRADPRRPPVQYYLPIAEMPIDVLMILGMGAAVGFISGMFGVGGGFLMTPLLIFVGVPPAVSVASVASHIAASSFSGALSLSLIHI